MGRLIGINTDIGNKRSLNEDAIGFYEDDHIGIYIVADGMGGHNAGEVASKIALDSILEYIKEHSTDEEMEKVLQEAIDEANKNVYKYAILNENCTGMGTTVTMAYVKGNKLIIGNVGDSRCYILSKGNLIKITKDHSLVQELLDNGTITEEEAVSHPNKNIITRAVGTKIAVKGDFYTLDLKEINKVILCTDGLTNEVSEEEILQIVNYDNGNSCIKLIELSKEKGGRDNISVIIFKGECTDDWNHIR
jgi:PPM family protein phosphatase